MQGNNSPKWYDSYRYIGRDLKVFWDRNGGKICTIAGTTGLFLSGTHACRKTYKIHDKLAKNGRKIREAGCPLDGDGKFTRLFRKSKTIAECSLRTAKDYLPDIVGGVLSGYCVSKGWQIENTHFKETTAMVGVIAGSFMNYRQNVIAELGPEADRRYLTTKRENRKAVSAKLSDGTVAESGKGDGQDITVNLEPGLLRIWYSRETTPQIWSTSHVIRLQYLDGITAKLDTLLKCGGHFTINDVRREFYGVKGDIGVGAMFGRVWDPGNPEHPERGASVNLHYMDDEDFACGLKDSCWVIIDIDDEPLVESLRRDKAEDIPGVEL